MEFKFKLLELAKLNQIKGQLGSILKCIYDN